MMQRRNPTSSSNTTTSSTQKPLSQRSSSTTRITSSSGGSTSARQPSSSTTSGSSNTRGTRLTSASSTTSSTGSTTRRANSTNARGTTTKPVTGSNATNGLPLESKPVKKLSQARYDKHKTANPFTAKNKFKTTFGGVYEAGGIPCRIHHTAAHMHLSWEKPLPDIPYDPLILTVADGLRETDHPYIFIVQKAFEEMCQAEESAEKIIPLLRQITSFIRMALQSKENVVFENALSAVQHLTACVGDAIVPHLPLVLVQISKKTFDKKYANKIMDVLQSIEQSCDSAEVVKLIKAKVPTYVNLR